MEVKEILLVDQKAPVISTIGFILQCHGFLTMVAPDSRTAAEDVRNYQFDLLLVSLNGYEADKLDLLRQVKRSSPQSKVMVVGNPQTMAFPMETFKIAVDDYLLTPFTAPELCLRVDRCLGKNGIVDVQAKTEEKADMLNERILNSLKFKIRDMHNTVYSLLAHINTLIENNNNLLNDNNIKKMNDISDDLITMMNITEEVLFNFLICGEKNQPTATDEKMIIYNN